MERNNYNGWANYQTWCVKLWLDNDEYECNHHLPALTHAAYEDATATTYSTREQSARYDLADTLREYVDELNPLADQASMFSDLLTSALSDVDWQEIAEHYIDELDKSEFEEAEEEAEAEYAPGAKEERY